MGRIRRSWGEGRAEATALRLQGRSYNEIQSLLGIPKSTLSNWLSDVALSDEQRDRLAARSEVGIRSRAVAIRASRIRRTEVLQEEAAAEVGPISDRELFLLGVALYWAEGSKEKPWGRATQMALINSDPDVIRLFIRWLGVIGVEAGDLILRLSIHESADVEAAERFWRGVVSVDASQWRRPSLKRHRATTVRHNIGPSYVGCLIVSVRRSTELNRRVAGWWAGIAAATSERIGTLEPPSGMV